MMRHLLPCVAALGLAAGCGDNSAACGDGTVKNSDGFCVPSGSCGPGTVVDPTTMQCVPDGTIVCSDGTVFDPTSGTCVIDPNACQPPFKLIGNVCQDPTGGLVADLEEGNEPNGLGVIEVSQVPAGIIALKAVGDPNGFVIHGHLNPWRDVNQDGQLDPDADSYVLQVSGPTLLDVTADGVNGIDGGFAVVANVANNSSLASWRRFGMNVTSDLSRRQVFLPSAGAYYLAVADTRTLFQYSTGGPTDAAPGGPDSQYYITINQLALPTPTPLTVSETVATATGTISGDVQFFSVAMDVGFNSVAVAMPAVQALAAAVVINNGSFRSNAYETVDGNGLPVPAQLIVGGIAPTDTTLVVVDNAYNYALSPVDFSLEVDTGTASALSATGGDVSEPELSDFPGTISQFNQFYYDVAAADDVLGINIAWSTPVDGVIANQDGTIWSTFSYDPFFGFAGDTWASYEGLLRHPAPGRYYFVVYDPNNGGEGTLTATSTLTAEPPPAVALGTATALQTVNAFASNAFTLDSTTSDWDVFEATGTATGNLAVRFYDRTLAYGRLDNLIADTSNVGGGPGTTLPPDPDGANPPGSSPLFGYSFPAAGAPHGRIVIDQPTRQYFVLVNTANGTGTFVLDFAARQFHDFGTVAAGEMGTASGETLDATTRTNFYLVRSDAANQLAITASPTTGSLDTTIQLINDDESPSGALVNNGGAGQPDDASSVFPSTATPFIAWEISTPAALSSPAMYDLTAAVAGP